MNFLTVPRVLDSDGQNPWGATSVPMFHGSDDSHDFIELNGAEIVGLDRVGNRWWRSQEELLPIYEGKMFWHYDHRYGTYEGQSEKQANKGVLPRMPTDAKVDPAAFPLPRYLLSASRVRERLEHHDWDRDWLFAFRDVGPSERTFINSVLPVAAVTRDNSPLLVPGRDVASAALYVATLSSLAVDFALRQKTSRMKWYAVWQAPVLPPETAGQPLLDSTVLEFVAPRVAELVYTAHDLAAFADDIGFTGQPFRWDKERRSVLQAELDALMFLLYGLDRDDTEWVLDSFDVLRKYEERPPEKGGVGEFRTKRLVLERYDAMTKAADTGTGYDAPLDPPPADDAMRHPS